MSFALEVLEQTRKCTSDTVDFGQKVLCEGLCQPRIASLLAVRGHIPVTMTILKPLRPRECEIQSSRASRSSAVMVGRHGISPTPLAVAAELASYSTEASGRSSSGMPSRLGGGRLKSSGVASGLGREERWVCAPRRVLWWWWWCTCSEVRVSPPSLLSMAARTDGNVLGVRGGVRSDIATAKPC